MSPFIVEGRVGLVHATSHGGTTCAAAAAAKRIKRVTSNQAMVYRLPRCGACWPADLWEKFLGGTL